MKRVVLVALCALVCLVSFGEAVREKAAVKSFLRNRLRTRATLEPRICCQAMTASCRACSAGQTVDEYCEEHRETPGCEQAGGKSSVYARDNFKDGQNRELWKTVRAGGVDTEGCGTGKPAMRFKALDTDNFSPPSITTKPIDLFGGGELEFSLKFCSGDTEGGEFAESNGVVVEYSLDGKKWEKFQVFLKSAVGESLSKGFQKTTLKMNKKHHLRAVSSHTSFKFTQVKAERGNWAITDVVIRQYPVATTAEDDFKTKKPGVWSYPPVKKGKDAYKYILSPRGVEFTGSANAQHTIGLQRAFTHALTVSASVVKNDKCSSHFMALSRRTNFAFSWGKSPGEIKVGFNCNQRFVYSPWGNKVVKCPSSPGQRIEYKLKLVVDQFNIIFSDEENKCETITIDNSPFVGGHGKPHFLFIGADQDKPNMVSLFKNIKVEQSEWDAKGRDLPSVLISDNFEKKNSDNWQITGLSQKLYRFGPDGLTAAQYGDIKGSNAPMRSTEAYNLPIAVQTTVKSFSKSANYYIAVSPNAEFQWNGYPDKESLKFEWSCESKTFIGMGEVKEAKASKGECDATKCTDDALHKIEVKIFPDLISFKDNCCNMISMPNKWGMEAPVHVFVGATRRDKAAAAAKFVKLTVKGQERPPAIEDESILMDDNFDFNDEKNPSMWTLSGDWKTTGVVSKKCGASEGSAMVFSNTGTRVATLKPLTFPFGAKLNFDLKFGGGAISCARMDPEKGDKVELRASTDGGKTWEHIEEWKASVFKENLGEWNKMEFNFVKSLFPNLARSTNVLLQFIQPGYHRPCCGHWAIDTVRVTSLEVKGEPIFTETFESKNTALFTYPDKSANKHAYTYGFEDGMYFTGDANGKTTVRTTKPLQAGTVIKASFDKNEACSNQFIAISKRPELKFFWGTPKDAIYFMWNCKQKYVYAPDNRTSVECPQLRKFNVIIRATEEGVVFEDDKCESIIMNTNSEIGQGAYYLHVGAAQDRSDNKARFTSLRVERLPDKEKSFMDTAEADNFEKQDKKKWSYPNLNDMKKIETEAKAAKQKATKALEETGLRMEDISEQITTGLDAVAKAQRQRREVLVKLEATDKEFSSKQKELESIAGEIAKFNDKMKKTKLSLAGKKAKYQIDKEEVASKRAEGASPTQIKGAEEAMKASEEDMLYEQNTLKKWVKLVKDLTLKADKIKGSINSPIRPILVESAKIEKLEKEVLEGIAKLGGLKDKRKTLSAQAEKAEKEVERVQKAIADGISKEEDIFPAMAAARKVSAEVKEATTWVVKAVANLTDIETSLNATQRKVSDMAMDTLTKLKGLEKRAEHRMKDANHFLKMKTRYKDASDYELKNARILLIKAKKGTTEEAADAAAKVSKLETELGKRVQAQRAAQEGALKATETFQGAQNKSLAFEAFHSMHINASKSQEELSASVRQESLVTQQSKEAQTALETATASLHHAMAMKSQMTSGGLGFAVAYGSLTIDPGMATTIRMKEMVEQPATIKVTVKRKDECDNQVVVLSPSPVFTWPLKRSSKAIAFRFACNEKISEGKGTVKMISGANTYLPLAKNKCNPKDQVDMIIKSSGGYVTFKDNAGCDPLTTSLPFGTDKFFVFIGAIKPKKTSTIVNFELKKPELPPKLARNVILYDDFDFHDNIWKPQWNLDKTDGEDNTNGVVDKFCGSAMKPDGNSLRFAKEGRRIATTKVMDLTAGGLLTYSLRFGFGNNTHNAMCAPMANLDDCIVLEYCTRDCEKAQIAPAKTPVATLLDLGAVPVAKIAQKGERTVKTFASYPNRANLVRFPEEDTSVNARMPVVCCKGDTKFDSSNYGGCHMSKSYDEATKICHKAGADLCTLDEIRQYRAKGTGIGCPEFDRKRIWSRSGEKIVQAKNPSTEDEFDVPHNKPKAYAGGWEELKRYSVKEYQHTLSREWSKQQMLLDWDNKFMMTSNTALRFRQCNVDNDAAENHWALDDIKIVSRNKPVRPGNQPKNILVNDKFDGDDSDRFNMQQWWWDMWRTTGRTDSSLVGGYKDVGQSLTFGGNISLRTDNSAWQIAQTPPIDTVSDGGVTFAFYMKFGRKDMNVSEHMRGVEFQYSTTGPDGEFKILKSWTDVKKFSDWSRQLIQIDNCSTPAAMTNGTIFRFIMARNEEVAANPRRDIWAIDNFQALTGDRRIGWETHGLKARDDMLFCYQEPRQITPYKYEYVEDEAGGLEFSGNGVGKGSVRAHSSFQSPLSVAATLVKDDECSNHYVVLTPEKYYTFSWDREPNTFKFVWRCDRKVLITPYSTTSTSCADFRTYKTRMKVSHEGAEFRDDGGCGTLRADIGMPLDMDFYVYFGAVQKGDESQMTDRVLMDNDQPAINETWLNTSSMDYNETELADEMQTNETNSPHLDIAFLEQKQSVPTLTTCAKALERTCGNVLGQMCLECYVKNSKRIIVDADGLVCNLRQAKSICATNAHLDKDIVVENERLPELSKKSGKPARFVSMRIGGTGSFINKVDASHACPSLRDCGLSSWGRWGKCDKVCGDGTSRAFRKVIRPPKFGGNKCPEDSKLVRTRSCNVRSCDCHVSEWTDFSCCTQPCADPKYDPPIAGKQFRTRRVILPPLKDGMACPTLNHTRECNQERCAAVGIPPLGQTKKFLNNTKFEPFVAANYEEFCLQEPGKLGSYKYDYVAKTDPSGEKFGVFFTGDSRGQSSLRGKKSFRVDDLVLETKIDKNSRCANHWIALSPDEFFTWNYEQEPKAIKAGWYCDYKFLITPTGNFTTKCNRIRKYNVSLTIKDNIITFADDQCAPLKGRLDLKRDYHNVYTYLGADHIAGKESITLAKPLTVDQVNALEEQRGTMGPKGGSDDGLQNPAMSKQELEDLENNVTAGHLNVTNGTSTDPTPPELDTAHPRKNMPLDRLMTRNIRTQEIESHKTATAKQFRETRPSEIVQGASAWLIANPVKGELTSDYLKYRGSEIQLYRFNGIANKWEKTSNPLPLNCRDEFVAAGDGWDDGLFVRNTEYLRVYAVGKIDMIKSPAELMMNGTEYHGREPGPRGSEGGSGGITAHPLLAGGDAAALAFVEMVPGRTMKTLPGNPLFDKRVAKDSPITERHAVRCCWNKDSKLMMEAYGCHKDVTYTKAKSTCEEHGFRLCSIEEVKAGKVAETGCGYDVETIWTSSGGEDGDDDATPQPEKAIKLAKDPVGDCVTVPAGLNNLFRGVDLSGKKMCCDHGHALDSTTRNSCKSLEGEKCYLYGGDLMTATPHPCSSVRRETGWKLVFKQTVEKDFQGRVVRRTVNANGEETVNKGDSSSCAPAIGWFKDQMLNTGLKVEHYMVETVYQGAIKSQAVGKVKDITGDETFFGGITKGDRGVCLKKMKLLVPFGDKTFNAQISYGEQKDASDFCNYGSGKTSVNSYMVADNGASDQFGADFSFFAHRNSPGQFSTCQMNKIFNTDNDDKVKRSIAFYVKGKVEKTTNSLGMCPGGALELKNQDGDARFCNAKTPCPIGYSCDTKTNKHMAVCCGTAVEMNTTKDLDGRLPVPGEPEKNMAVFTFLRVSGPGTLVNTDDGSKTCPSLIDCQVTGWGEWEPCTQLCGGGNKTRRRKVLKPSQYGGRECPALAQVGSCNAQSCDCGVTKFTEWSECSKDCGGGLTARSRKVFREPQQDGEACPHLNETEVCNNMTCPFVGMPPIGVSKFQLKNTEPEGFKGREDKLWCYEKAERLAPYKMGYVTGDNIAFSGSGVGRTTLRSRFSFQAPLQIDLALDYEQVCDNHYVILSTDEYYMFKTGNEPDTIKFMFDCGHKRVQTENMNETAMCMPHIDRKQKITINIDEFGNATFADLHCPSVSVQDMAGSLGKNKDFFVYVGANRDDPPQQASQQLRTTFHTVVVSGEGSVINNYNTTTECPGQGDCKVEPWTEFSNCTAPCNNGENGGGNHTRTRKVIKFPTNGGKACPALTETRRCNIQKCGEDCVVSDFSPWGNCSEPCNGGEQWRVRAIVNQRVEGSHFGKNECPALKEKRTCNTMHCGKDCVVDRWSGWSKCSAPCGGGVRARRRVILSAPVKGVNAGKACPALEETKPCNTHSCMLEGVPQPITYDNECSRLSGSCGGCTANPKCGYCPGTGQCMLGSVRGPTPRWDRDEDTPTFMHDEQKAFMYATNCSSWEFSYCSANSCQDYKGCGDCLKDQFCGWCPSTNKCLEGDSAGSTEVGGYCPRGWLHSPLHSGYGEEQRYDSLLSPSQKKVQQGHLTEYCAANNLETRASIAEKMMDETKRQEQLRLARETCLPCTGTWPNCHCGQDQVMSQPKPVDKLQVTREQDQADGVDQTLPRNDTVETLIDHGKPSFGVGAVCKTSSECSSKMCGGGHCCSVDANGCTGNGICNELGNCVCKEGWFGPQCNRDSNITVGKEFDGNSTAELEKEGLSKNMVDEMKNALAAGNASMLLKVMHEKNEIDRQNQASSQEYLGAVKNFSSKVDSLKVTPNAEKQVSVEAANADLNREDKLLKQKRIEQEVTSKRIERTSDPVARSQLQNQLDIQKNVAENMEAGLAAKLSVTAATGGK